MLATDTTRHAMCSTCLNGHPPRRRRGIPGHSEECCNCGTPVATALYIKVPPQLMRCGGNGPTHWVPSEPPA